MVPVDDRSELELRDYLRVLRRRKWFVFVAVVVVAGAALASSLVQTPVYRATAEIILQGRSTESVFDPAGVRQVEGGADAATEVRTLKSDPVRAIVRQKLGSAPSVSVRAVTETDYILVSAESTDPARAALVANTWANAYQEYRRDQQVSEIRESIDQLTKSIEGLNAQIAATEPPPAPTARSPFVDDAGTRDALIRDRDLFASRRAQLELTITQKSGGVTVQTPAEAPTSPVRPTPLRTTAIAAIVGLLLGIGVAFLIEYLDDSLNSKEDVERVLPDMPILGLIPAVPGWKERKDTKVVSLSDPKGSAAEAYRSLRTSIQFLGVDRPLGVIQITSPGASEGKSTTIANLAVALASAGQRVVIVCCDLRRPRIHEFFGLTNTVGFTSVLLGDVPLSAALQPISEDGRLVMLASGPPPPNPSELLGSRRTSEVIDTLRAGADVVLVDTPPLLPVTDAAVLSHRVDGLLLVAAAGETTRKELARARELLGQVDAPVLGVVLNGLGGEGVYGYGYGYGYYGTPESGRAKGDRKGDRKKAAAIADPVGAQRR